MSKSVVNEIIKGIAGALYEAFGEGYEIYQNDVRQGLIEPCFFIAPLKPDAKSLLGSRRLRRNPFDICYYPKEPEDNGELQEVAEQLLDALAFIRLEGGDLLRGTDMSWEAPDDELHFFVSYKLTQYNPTRQTAMEDLKTKVTQNDGR